MDGLENIKVYNMTPEGDWEIKNLKDSPFYLSLKHQSRKIYEKYYKTLTESSQFKRMPKFKRESELTYDEFIDLYRNIKTIGGCKSFKPMFDENNILIDGQHRVAIIYHLSKINEKS